MRKPFIFSICSLLATIALIYLLNAMDVEGFSNREGYILLSGFDLLFYALHNESDVVFIASVFHAFPVSILTFIVLKMKYKRELSNRIKNATPQKNELK